MAIAPAFKPLVEVRRVEVAFHTRVNGRGMPQWTHRRQRATSKPPKAAFLASAAGQARWRDAFRQLRHDLLQSTQPNKATISKRHLAFMLGKLGRDNAQWLSTC